MIQSAEQIAFQILPKSYTFLLLWNTLVCRIAEYNTDMHATNANASAQITECMHNSVCVFQIHSNTVQTDLWKMLRW